MARPMFRVPPVTIATRPSSLNIALFPPGSGPVAALREVTGHTYVPYISALDEAARHACQDLPRPELDEARDAGGSHEAYRFVPANRLCHLHGELLADGSIGIDDRGAGVGHNGHRRSF